MATHWSDDRFLDELRGLSDPAADACVAALPREESLEFVFSRLRADSVVPAELPEPLRLFVREVGPTLDLGDVGDADRARIARGQAVFLKTCLPVMLVLLAKSLTEGYQAPRLAKVLMVSGALERSTYRRLLGVLQMIVTVASPGSFDDRAAAAAGRPAGLPRSDAALTALRLRLLHGGIRTVARRRFPDFTDRWGGAPVSLEDMLATIIGFSLLVVDGLRTFHVGWSGGEEEDYYTIWRVYARCMGIHPPGEPKSWAFVPPTLAEAREFYEAYTRRHYRPAADNDEGVLLARANLEMLAARLPKLLLQRLAPTIVPRVFMHALMGATACANLGIRPAPLSRLTTGLILGMPRLWARAWGVIDRVRGTTAKHEALSRIFLQTLIVREYDGAVTYRVVQSEEDIHALVRGTRPRGDYSREQFRYEVFPAELADVAARRAAVGLAPPPPTGAPSVTKGLVGLALSGGGIRSAAFALGAVQALARRGWLRTVDYLSTVSGGGYLGAAVSSSLNDADAGVEDRRFPFYYRPGIEEPPAVTHLRGGASYLAGSLLTALRLPMVGLRGLILNWVLLLPYIMLAALVTWIAHPLERELDAERMVLGLAIGAFLALVVSYPAVSSIVGTRLSWTQRDRYENLQTLSLAVLAGVVSAGLLGGPVSLALTTDWGSARAVVLNELRNPLEIGDVWKWVVLAAAVGAQISVGRIAQSLSRPMTRVFVCLIGLIGPVLVFGVYLVLLLVFARSPLLATELTAALDRADARDGQLAKDLFARGIGVAGPVRVTVVKAGDAWRLCDPLACHDVRRHRDHLDVSGVGFGAHAADWWFAGIAVLLFVFNRLWVDVNTTSAHGFYRDRLSRVFLIRARWYGAVQANDGQTLSGLGTVNPVAPYHLINTALNLGGGDAASTSGRWSDFFVFSKRYVGSPSTGYCRTAEMEARDPRLNLGTAMAISAAAAAPNMGTTTVRPLRFILTLLNVRLGYWVPNPWFLQAPSLVRRLRLRHRPGPVYLLREALGLIHARAAFVNLSDGGHIENLAMYELLRRRCRLVIAVDAECDPGIGCGGLATLIRYARIDLGVEIDIDLAPLRPDERGISARQWAVGTIHYGDDETGSLLYVKSSLSGNEPAYVLDYRRRSPVFPHESTADQFFNEAQFEAYRAVGYDAMTEALAGVIASPDGAALRQALGVDGAAAAPSVARPVNVAGPARPTA